MRHRVRAVSRYEDRGLVRTRAAFVTWRGAEAVATRQRAIDALPSKDWRGTRVYRLVCEGPYGRGPHEVWLPERVLWALVDLGHYLCPFHL